MPDVFVSYSRKDTEFVKRLVGSLQAQGRDVWVDFEDIPFATDWWAEIVSGIDASDAVIFVLSPDSVQSDICSLELSHAIKSNKRLIPIVWRESQLYHAETGSFKIPKQIRTLNWIFFTAPNDYEVSYSKLANTLDTDLTTLRQHTKLLVLAREWEQKGRGDGFLLYGEELREMLPMLIRDDLTSLQRDYLTVSKAQQHMRAMLARFAWGFAGGMAGMGFYVFGVFRGATLLHPESVALALAAGEVFGVFMGMMAVLAYGLPDTLTRYIPSRFRAVFRVGALLMIGVLAWMVFQWFFLKAPFSLNWIAIMAGVGLSFGFILPVFVRLRPIVEYVLVVVGTYAPLYAFNSQSPILEAINAPRSFEEAFYPLIYFDDPRHSITVGLPMALLLALATVKPGVVLSLASRIRQRLGRIFIKK